MTPRCDLRDLTLIGEDESGAYLGIPHRCMKPTCEVCWKLLLNRRTWATRLAMAKAGVSSVWLGLIDDKDRVTARSWKSRHKDDVTTTVMNMLTTYQFSTECGLFATCNMIPSRDVLVEMSVEDGLSVNYRWAAQWRPKRVKADWELKLPGRFGGRFVLPAELEPKFWKELNDRWGYSPGDIPTDPTTFERRMYTVADELKNPGNESDDDMYAGA